MNIEDLFTPTVEEEENPLMTKDEYINQAREFIGKVNNIFWSNWGYRELNDDEFPSQEQCEKCDNHCVIKIGEYEYDCVPDREGGVCRIRVFDEANYSSEMEELILEFNHVVLLNPEIQLIEK